MNTKLFTKMTLDNSNSIKIDNDKLENVWGYNGASWQPVRPIASRIKEYQSLWERVGLEDDVHVIEDITVKDVRYVAYKNSAERVIFIGQCLKTDVVDWGLSPKEVLGRIITKILE